MAIRYHTAARCDHVLNKKRSLLLRPRYPRPFVANTTMMRPSEITEKFVEASNDFILIEGQPTDSDVNWVFETLSQILYPIEYDETDAVHNPIGIIQYDKPYKTKHA